MGYLKAAMSQSRNFTATQAPTILNSVTLCVPQVEPKTGSEECVCVRERDTHTNTHTQREGGREGGKEGLCIVESEILVPGTEASFSLNGLFTYNLFRHLAKAVC